MEMGLRISQREQTNLVKRQKRNNKRRIYQLLQSNNKRKRRSIHLGPW